MNIYTKKMIEEIEYLDIDIKENYLFSDDYEKNKLILSNITKLNNELNNYNNKNKYSRFINFISKNKKIIRNNCYEYFNKRISIYDYYIDIVEKIDWKIKLDNENINKIKNELTLFNKKYEKNIENIISNFITEENNDIVKKCEFCNEDEIFNINNFCCIGEINDEEYDECYEYKNFNNKLCCIDCKNKLLERNEIKDNVYEIYYEYYNINKELNYKNIDYLFFDNCFDNCDECCNDYINMNDEECFCNNCNNNICNECLFDCVICNNNYCHNCCEENEDEEIICLECKNENE